MSRILIAVLFLAATAMALPAEDRFFTYGGPSFFGPSSLWNWAYTPKIPIGGPAPAPAAPAPATATTAPAATTAAAAAAPAPAAATTPQLQVVPLGSLLFSGLFG